MYKIKSPKDRFTRDKEVIMQKFITKHSMKISGMCLIAANILLFIVEGSRIWDVLGVMSRDVVESVEGYAANRRVVSVVVVEVEPAGQRQASFGL